MKRSAVLVLAFLALPATAGANVEIGGTAGLHIFSTKSNLGYVAGPQATTEKNSALFGFRFGFYFSDALGVELEGGLIPSESRTLVFDVFNIAARGQVVYQFRANKPENNLVPFVLAGGGMIDLVSTNNSDVLKKDLEPQGQIGAGVKYRTANGWGVRFDARALFGKSNSSGVAVDFETLLSLYREFGRKTAAAPMKEEKTSEGAATGADADGDGIADAVDKCPKEAEDKDGFQDDDGCPDPDNDGDGVPDSADKCPSKAEDKDNFQDDDGCPDPDNDNDGVPDAADKCADQPETKNGYQDDDGCPDEIPDSLKAFIDTPVAGVTFRPRSDAFGRGATKELDKLAAALDEVKDVKIEVGDYTDDAPLPKKGKFTDADALSQARADAVKAYLVKKGIDEGRISTKGYGATKPLQDTTGLKGRALNQARAKNARIEITLQGAAEAAPAAGDSSATPDKTESTPTP